MKKNKEKQTSVIFGAVTGVNVDWIQAVAFDRAYLTTPEEIEEAKRRTAGLPSSVGLKRTLEGRDKEPLSEEDWKMLREIVERLQKKARSKR
jgi:hypothetical protein